MGLTKLVGCLLPFAFGTPTAIGGGGTCQNGAACGNAALNQVGPPARPIDSVNTEDVSALLQSKSAQVLPPLDHSRALPSDDPSKIADQAKVPPTVDPNKVADKTAVSMRPRMRKLMEMSDTVNDIKALAAAGATPEVAKIIKDLIRIIEEDLLPKIEEDHEFAKSAVGERIAELTKATESAVEAKTHADFADTTLDYCVTEEKGLIIEYETCKSQEAVLKELKDSTEFCGNPIFDFVGYTNHPQLPDTLPVDFSKGVASVHAELDGYLASLLQWMAVTKDQATKDQGTWETYDAKCKTKTQELADKTVECGERLGAWRTQHETCLHANYAQKISLCVFGHAYQAKCERKTAYDTLKTQITGTGTPYSQPDRKQEYRHLARLTCVLDIFKDTTELTTSAVDQCTKSNEVADKNFETALGSIDLKQTTYDLLTSQANFTCVDSAIKFGNGFLWEVPTNDGGGSWIPKSTEYKKVTGHKYSIASDASNAPFEFCLDKSSHETAPACGSTFDCSTGSGKQKPADTQCFIAGGCTSADCCSHMFADECSGVTPSSFKYQGLVGFGDTPALSSDNTYGVFSSSVPTNAAHIFDGVRGIWGQAGSSYRSTGQTGGMEIRFPTPTAIKTFIVHCIYANQHDLDNDICFGDGAYDLTAMNVQFWDGSAWQSAYAWSGDSNGSLEGTVTSEAFSQNWRFYVPPNTPHMGGDTALHLSEIDITQACET